MSERDVQAGGQLARGLWTCGLCGEDYAGLPQQCPRCNPPALHAGEPRCTECGEYADASVHFYTSHPRYHAATVAAVLMERSRYEQA